MTQKDKFGQWVSVEERLPEASKFVLFCNRDRQRFAGYGTLINSLPGREITHWMPLPEPPTEQSGNSGEFTESYGGTA